MVTIKISDLIAEFLEKVEIKVVFGIIGSANSYIFDSITKRGYTKIVCVHHEQAAVMAMGAYFRACGKMSAAIVTAGAGASNSITGVISNWADSIPGIIFSGQEQVKFIETYDGMRMYGIQGFNSSKMLKDVTKYSKTIFDATTIQDTLEQAYFISQANRPGPVWIDIPFDVQSKIINYRDWNIKPLITSLLCDAAPVIQSMDLNYILTKLKEAKRPLIWAGHGVRLSGMKPEFKTLVDQLQIPVILTWSAIDLLYDNHPLYFGRAGITGMRYSNFIVQNCDFLLVIGNRLSLLQTGYDITQFAPHAKIVVVDVDIGEWKKHPSEKYDKIIISDCRTIIKDLQNSKQSFPQPDWLAYCNKMKVKYPLIEKCHADNEYINSYNFLNYFNSKLQGNEVIVTDMGTALLTGHYMLRLKEDNIMFTSLGLGEMGYGLPGAIGAAFAYPDRNIICLHCDGGMMMNLQELQTIIHHRLRIKIIVFNNDGYLMIKNTQNMLFKGYHTAVNEATGVSCPNFSKLGKSLGFHVVNYVGPSWGYMDFKLKEFLLEDGPTIMEVDMDPNQEFLPKVKGVANEDGTITPAPLEEMSPLLPYKEIEEAMIAGVNPKSKIIKR